MKPKAALKSSKVRSRTMAGRSPGAARHRGWRSSTAAISNLAVMSAAMSPFAVAPGARTGKRGGTHGQARALEPGDFRRATMDNLWLAALSSADRKRIEPHLNERPFAQGQLLYDAGEEVDEVWFPITGVVSLMTLLAEDKMI